MLSQIAARTMPSCELHEKIHREQMTPDLNRYMLSILFRLEITKNSKLASSATGMYASRSFSNDICIENQLHSKIIGFWRAEMKGMWMKPEVVMPRWAIQRLRSSWLSFHWEKRGDWKVWLAKDRSSSFTYVLFSKIFPSAAASSCRSVSSRSASCTL